MIHYDCGCSSKGLLILDGTPTMLIAVENWDETDKSQCFHCWYDQNVRKEEPKNDECPELTPEQEKTLRDLDSFFTKIAMDDSYWENENDQLKGDT